MGYSFHNEKNYSLFSSVIDNSVLNLLGDLVLLIISLYLSFNGIKTKVLSLSLIIGSYLYIFDLETAIEKIKIQIISIFEFASKYFYVIENQLHQKYFFSIFTFMIVCILLSIFLVVFFDNLLPIFLSIFLFCIYEMTLKKYWKNKIGEEILNSNIFIDIVIDGIIIILIYFICEKLMKILYIIFFSCVGTAGLFILIEKNCNQDFGFSKIHKFEDFLKFPIHSSIAYSMCVFVFSFYQWLNQTRRGKNKY